MLLLIVLILLLPAPPIQAASGSSYTPLRDYVHTVWTQHDGVPLGSVSRILQTTDGYLWLVTRERRPTPVPVLKVLETSDQSNKFDTGVVA